MKTLIKSPADCEVGSFICFQSVKGLTAINTHCEIRAVYGESFMINGMVRKWSKHLKMPAQMCMMTNRVCPLYSSRFRWQRSLPTFSPHWWFELSWPLYSLLFDDFPQFYWIILFSIVTELFNYQKLCSCWVENVNGGAQKQTYGSALTFLENYHDGGHDFFWPNF